MKDRGNKEGKQTGTVNQPLITSVFNSGTTHSKQDPPRSKRYHRMKTNEVRDTKKHLIVLEKQERVGRGVIVETTQEVVKHLQTQKNPG